MARTPSDNIQVLDDLEASPQEGSPELTGYRDKFPVFNNYR
jgi:hypothetical protein